MVSESLWGQINVNSHVKGEFGFVVTQFVGRVEQSETRQFDSNVPFHADRFAACELVGYLNPNKVGRYSDREGKSMVTRSAASMIATKGTTEREIVSKGRPAMFAMT